MRRKNSLKGMVSPLKNNNAGLKAMYIVSINLLLQINTLINYLLLQIFEPTKIIVNLLEAIYSSFEIFCSSSGNTRSIQYRKAVTRGNVVSIFFYKK